MASDRHCLSTENIKFSAETSSGDGVFDRFLLEPSTPVSCLSGKNPVLADNSASTSESAPSASSSLCVTLNLLSISSVSESPKQLPSSSLAPKWLSDTMVTRTSLSLSLESEPYSSPLPYGSSMSSILIGLAATRLRED